MVGVTFSHYRILEKIGEGGMGVVYRAEDTNLDRTVALKFLAAHLLESEEHKQRLLREARATASLDHPNICMVHEVGESDGLIFLGMGFVDGREVRAKIKERPLKLDEALDIAIQAAEGLRAAHEKGIVHRDIKSSNLMLTSAGQLKILDFGLAQLTDGTRLTRTDTVMGTPAYMSPEQAQRLPTDRRTDIWSLGVVLYEMVTGRLPFEGEREAAVVYSIVHEPHEPITALRLGVPTALDRIVGKALEKRPDERYQHVEDMLVDLRALRQGQSAAGAKVAPVRPRKLRKLWWSAAATVVIGTLLWLREPASPPGRDQWVQLTNFPDSVGQPALSSDGRMLAFIRGPGTFQTTGQIYVKLLPDGEPKQLTRDTYRKMSPEFSPDGSQIAYTTIDSQFKWDTWLVPVLGGEPRRWLPNASGLIWIDQQKLLFSRIKTGMHMAIVTAEPTQAGERDLYVPAHERGMAHRSYASPDGKWALVVEMDQTGTWVPCRLVPMDGRSQGRAVGPPGGCTFAAWSPDGKWIYATSGHDGDYHVWRQRFPDGQPAQVTFGPTEEEGIAMAPDGRSFITAVALKQRPIMLHDSSGDRQVSLEGYAYFPKFTPDGKKLLYQVLKGPSPNNGTSDLWLTELDSGRNELLFPNLANSNALSGSFDVSADGKQVVVRAIDRDGKLRLSLISVDHTTPPRQILNVEGDNPLFGPTGEIFFLMLQGTSSFVQRVAEDGTGLRKVLEPPIANITGISRNGQWLATWSPLLGARTAPSIVYPTGSGSPVPIWGRDMRLQWSPDGRLLFMSLSSTAGSAYSNGKTYVVPLAPGRVLPGIPPGGFQSEEELLKIPGVRVIEAADVAPGPTPDEYAFSRETTQRNLYRIPIP